MKLFPSRIRDLSFWHYQIIGWFFFAILHLVIVTAVKGWNEKILLNIALQVFTGFLLTSLLRFYYQKIRFQELSLFTIIALVGACSLGITLVWFGIFIFIQYSFIGAEAIIYLAKPLHAVLIVAYTFPDKLAWSALYFGIKFWLVWLDEREHTEKATEAAQRAQLQMLRYQLNPHFLFNALNSVRALIDEDARGAKVMITELSEFLRYSLVSRNKPIVTLKEEIDALQLYLSIEQQRYEDKLQIAFDIDRRSENVSIPSFLIQPLVEQALRCGMQSGTLPLKVEIRTGLSDGILRIAVIHSGCKMQLNGTGMNGSGNSGLVQAEARLHSLFPNRYRLATSHNNDTAQVIVELMNTNGVMHEEKVTGYSR